MVNPYLCSPMSLVVFPEHRTATFRFALSLVWEIYATALIIRDAYVKVKKHVALEKCILASRELQVSSYMTLLKNA